MDSILESERLAFVTVRNLLRLSLILLCSVVLAKVVRKGSKNGALYAQIPSLPISFPIGTALGTLQHFYLYYFTDIPINVALGQIAIGLSKLFHQTNAGIFFARIGVFRNLVIVIKARTAETVLTDHKNIVKSSEYGYIAPWLGRGLLLARDEHWRRHRKLLTPAFHFEILDKFLPTMNTKVNIMMDLIGRKCDSTTGVAHIPDIRPYITNCTVDIICETAMGIKLSGQEEWEAKQNGATFLDTPTSKYSQAVKSFLDKAIQRVFIPWYRFDFMFKLMPLGRKMAQDVQVMHNFTNSVIASRKAELESKLQSKSDSDPSQSGEDVFRTMSKSKRVAFLDLLLGYHLKDPHQMDLVSIREEVDTFMFGGHDTTSAALHFGFLLLGINVDKQRKIQSELDEIFDGEERQITLDDCRKMHYLELAIKEVLRLYPPAAFFARQVIEEMTIDGYKVPVGTTLAILSYGVHRDPELYDNAEAFIPERFEQNSKANQNSFGYIPFSAGARNCIGQRFAMLELKIVIATVLRKYNLRAITKQEDVETEFSAITKCNTPIEVQFTQRSNIKAL